MKMRALVFDDDAAIRSLVWTVMDHRGYEVFTFPDPGICPLHVAKQCACSQDQSCSDIILSDLDMPNVKGLDFVESLLNKGCRCKHIALMSGGWSPEEMEHAKSLGLRTFSKPFPIAELSRWLDEVEAASDPDRRLSDWFTGNAVAPSTGH
jgi:DNA-binding response OmpR family regulator